MSDIDVFSIEKQPADIRSRAIDFSNKVPTGVTIESASLTCVIEETGEDVTSTILVDDAGVVQGESVIITVRGGDDGERYKVTIEATLSTGDILTADIFVDVREY